MANEPTETTPKAAPILYWFRGRTDVTPSLRARFGLEPGAWGRFTQSPFGKHNVQRANCIGPVPGDRVRGLLAAVGDSGTIGAEWLVVDTATQDWTEIEEDVFLGIAHDADANLYLREKRFPTTYFVKTDRGWLFVPVAMIDEANCDLPSRDQLSQGEWHSVPLPEFVPLSAMAMQVYRAEIGEVDPLTRPERREITVAAISVNYALTAAEMGGFGFLTDDVYGATEAVLTDLQARTEKKTAQAQPDTADTSSGGQDD